MSARTTLLLAALAASFAGCSEPPLAFGNLYTVTVTGAASGCTIHLPIPVVDGKPWEVLNWQASPGVSHERLESEKGPALRLRGTGDMAASGAGKAPETTPAVLSLQQGEWNETGGLARTRYLISGEGCGAAQLILSWRYDVEPKSQKVEIQGPVGQGWGSHLAIRGDDS